jgi:mycoredoxin
MKEVIVYSACWCQGCKSIKKGLSEKGIPFTEVDIDTEEGMLKAKELGIRNIPVTVINGEKFIGSSPEVFKAILKEIE